MSIIDMSESINDPDFCRPFSVRRRYQTVDDTGNAVMLERIACIFGVVFPARGNVLRMLPDYTNIDGAIEIWTMFELSAATTHAAADQICYEGNVYTVTTAERYAGFAIPLPTPTVTVQDGLVASAPDPLEPAPGTSLRGQRTGFTHAVLTLADLETAVPF